MFADGGDPGGAEFPQRFRRDDGLEGSYAGSHLRVEHARHEQCRSRQAPQPTEVEHFVSESAGCIISFSIKQRPWVRIGQDVRFIELLCRTRIMGY